MKIVLDVSVAFALVRNQPGMQWIRQAIEAADEVIVPDLYISEASNTAWKFYHIEDASLEEIQLLANRSLALPDQIIPSTELWEEALLLAHSLDHPVYDCLYLALAQQESAHLLTLDKRLRKLATKLDIRLIQAPS